MKNLYINTCGNNVIIKYFKKYNLIKEEIVVGQKNNSQFIMPSIKKVLDGDIPDGIVVVVGPGSFTGIRLGVTIGKTFAYVKNIPIRTISSLEEVAVSLNMSEKHVAIKENNGYFVGKFNKDNIALDDYLYYSNEDYFNLKETIYLVDIIDYKKVLKFVLDKDPVNPHTIKPVYVKVIEVLK